MYQAAFGPVIAYFGEFENGCRIWIWARDIAGVVVGGADYWWGLDKFVYEGFPSREQIWGILIARYEIGKRFCERLGGVVPLFAQVICATSRRDVRDEFGTVIVKRFFKRAKGIDDAVCERSGISGLADVVEGVIAAPFVDDYVVVGCDDAGDRDAVGEEAVCNLLFNGEQVEWFAAREPFKEVVFNRKYRAVSRYFPDCMRSCFGDGFDFCNALFRQFIVE